MGGRTEVTRLLMIIIIYLDSVWHFYEIPSLGDLQIILFYHFLRFIRAHHVHHPHFLGIILS